MQKKTTDYAEMVYIRKKILKISASEMARIIGVSTETYLRSERGERDFSLFEAMKIANKFEMPIAQVFPKIFALDVA